MRAIQSSSERALDLRTANEWGVPAEGGEQRLNEEGERVPDLSNKWETQGMHPDTLKYWQDWHAQNPQGGQGVETPHRTPFGGSESHLGRVASKSSARDEWQKDNVINGYRISNLSAKFSCNCGKDFTPDGMHRCACGQTWTSYVIVPNGKQASQAVRIVRQVNEHRERVLAKMASDNAYVRNNQTDVAPVVFEDDEPRKTAAGGWGDPTQPGFEPVSENSAASEPASDPTHLNKVRKAPTTTTPKVTPMTNTKNTARKQANPYGQHAAPQGPVDHATDWNSTGWGQNEQINPSTDPGAHGQIGTDNMEGDQWSGYYNPAGNNNPFNTIQTPNNLNSPDAARAEVEKLVPETGAPGRHRASKVFDESEYRMGWALASSDSPLPPRSRKMHASFLEGYVDFYKTADFAPGQDTIKHLFEDGDSGNLETMDRSEDIDNPTQEVRNDLATKIDRDNNKGQSGSDDTMGDLDGWKTSALLAEIARRAR